MTRVFLTGGTGLIGSHVAELLRRRGRSVVCLQRPASDTRHLRRLGCRIVEGDIGEAPEDLARAMEGCATLVHSAALVYPRASWPRIRAVNVEGTRRIVEAADLAGIRRVVHLSSVAVYGDPGRDDGSDREGSSLYARSKKASEEVATGTCDRRGLELCILRPAGVYGERDRALTPALGRLVRLSVTPLLGSGRETLPLVYAGNVAEAVALCVDAPEAPGRIFDIGEDDPVTQREALRALARGMGAKIRLLPLPAPLLETFAHLWDSAVRPVFSLGGPSLLRTVRLGTRGNPFSSRDIRETLGWDPSTGSIEALEGTGRWLVGSLDGGMGRAVS